MKTPFKIKFKKEICETSNKRTINDYCELIRETDCGAIDIINKNKIVITNKPFRIRPGGNLNMWVGIGNAELEISFTHDNRNKIIYTFDFTRLSIFLIISSICLISFFLFSGIEFKNIKAILKPVGIMYSIFVLFSLGIPILRQWSLFKDIANYEKEK